MSAVLGGSRQGAGGACETTTTTKTTTDRSHHPHPLQRQQQVLLEGTGPGTRRHFELWDATRTEADRHRLNPWIRLGITGKVTAVPAGALPAAGGAEMAEKLKFFKDAQGCERSKTKNFALSTQFRYGQTAPRYTDPTAPSPFAGRPNNTGPWFANASSSVLQGASPGRSGRSDGERAQQRQAEDGSSSKGGNQQQQRTVEAALVSLGVPLDLARTAAGEGRADGGVKAAMAYLTSQSTQLGKSDRARLEESMRQRASWKVGQQQKQQQQHQHQNDQSKGEKVGMIQHRVPQVKWGPGMNGGVITPRRKFSTTRLINRQ